MYIIVGLSALLVSTYRAMREPLNRGTSNRIGSTSFCVCNQCLICHSGVKWHIKKNMGKKEKKEKLQTRREFFKNAAKKTLPILATIAMATTPCMTKASESSPMGCSGNCSFGCGQVCSGDCYGGCKGGCGGACSYSCQNTCKGYCNGSCRGGCSSMNSY